MGNILKKMNSKVKHILYVMLVIIIAQNNKEEKKMAKIIESKITQGEKSLAYVEIQFAHATFVVYADGTAYLNGLPQKFGN